MRPDQELDVRPLYLSGVSAIGSGGGSSRQSRSEGDSEGDVDSGAALEGMSGYDASTRPDPRSRQ